MPTQCTECHSPLTPTPGLTYEYLKHGIIHQIHGLTGSTCSYCGAIEWSDASRTIIRNTVSVAVSIPD